MKASTDDLTEVMLADPTLLRDPTDGGGRRVRRDLFIACSFSLAAAALSAGATMAGLSVCVKPNNGAMRAVANVSACAANENPVGARDRGRVGRPRGACPRRWRHSSRVQAGPGTLSCLAASTCRSSTAQAATDSENSLGNVIIGYNSSAVRPQRKGSHNLVIGDEHSYTRHSGLCLRIRQHALRRNLRSSAAGSENTASGKQAFVGGGSGNTGSRAGRVRRRQQIEHRHRRAGIRRRRYEHYRRRRQLFRGRWPSQSHWRIRGR